MNPDDAFESILASLYRAMLDDAQWPAASALIDEVCGIGGSSLVVGEGSSGGERIHFARYLCRGESRQDLARYCFDIHYPTTRACAGSWNCPKADWFISLT